MGMNTVPIGIVLQLLACTCGAGGVNLQKYAQMPEVASCKLNVLGITGTVVGGLMEMVAQSFAPQSTLAPLGASALVINLLLAPKVNKDEVITRLDIAAVCIIGSGVVSVLIAAINSPPLPTFDGPELADFMSRTAAVVFVTLLAGVIVACIFGVCKVERTMKRGEIGVWGALYAVLSGTQASTTVLSSKVIGETLKVGAPGDVGWGFFIAAAAAVTISGISNMLIMNRGLGRGLQTLLAIPIFYGTAVCLNAIAGGMFWGEFEHFTSGQLVAVPFGVSCVIAGVVLLLIKAKRSSAKLEPSNGLATNVSISFSNLRAKNLPTKSHAYVRVGCDELFGDDQSSIPTARGGEPPRTRSTAESTAEPAWHDDLMLTGSVRGGVKHVSQLQLQLKVHAEGVVNSPTDNLGTALFCPPSEREERCHGTAVLPLAGVCDDRQHEFEHTLMRDGTACGTLAGCVTVTVTTPRTPPTTTVPQASPARGDLVTAMRTTELNPILGGASAEEASGRAGLCTPSAVHTVVEDAHAPASPPRRGHPPIKLPPLTPTGVPGGTSGGLPAFSGSPRGDQRVAGQRNLDSINLLSLRDSEAAALKAALAATSSETPLRQEEVEALAPALAAAGNA